MVDQMYSIIVLHTLTILLEITSVILYMHIENKNLHTARGKKIQRFVETENYLSTRSQRKYLSNVTK